MTSRSCVHRNAARRSAGRDAPGQLSPTRFRNGAGRKVVDADNCLPEGEEILEEIGSDCGGKFGDWQGPWRVCRYGPYAAQCAQK